jgi:hypothetical protein
MEDVLALTRLIRNQQRIEFVERRLFEFLAGRGNNAGVVVLAGHGNNAGVVVVSTKTPAVGNILLEFLLVLEVHGVVLAVAAFLL